jgi:hypothetical protein
MNVVLPMVAMVFLGVLCVGSFLWMRRPKFGESEKPAMRSDARSMTALSNPMDDYRGGEHSLRNVRDGSGSPDCQVVTLKSESL